jgi:vancomycin resistance protein VanW
MKQSLPAPQIRSRLRMAVGKRVFIARRWLEWQARRKTFAWSRHDRDLPHLHASHQTPVLRQLKGIDMWLQHNKADSLRVAASCIDGIILKPGEVFSFWRLVGRPSLKRGFKVGMVLRNGEVGHGIGGGLCQMTNLIYWMTLHTELTVTERWRHGFDVFPDESRTQPFASGATCSYNYIDLQITNGTPHLFQLRLTVNGGVLRGAWRAAAPRRFAFEVIERDHAIQSEWWGGYSRHNALYRLRADAETGLVLGDEFLAENHAIMMYQPLLAAI